MTSKIHYMNSRWKWDFNGSYMAVRRKVLIDLCLLTGYQTAISHIWMPSRKQGK